MDTPTAQAFYWGFSGLALTFLLLTLTPLFFAGGVRFQSTPTRDQAVSLGLFGFAVGLGVFGVRQVPFVVFMAAACLAVLFQSWGPKRWDRGRVYGAYFVPLKIRGWRRDDDKVLVRLSWGCRILVRSTPANAEFLGRLAAERTEGEGME